MKEDEIRFCEFCQHLIPDHLNKNTRYCSRECYDNNKAKVAAERNLKRAHSLILIKNDDIIHDLYLLYESRFYISAIELINRGFNWSIHNGELFIDNLKSKRIIRYGYTLFNDQRVRLWKL